MGFVKTSINGKEAQGWVILTKDGCAAKAISDQVIRSIRLDIPHGTNRVRRDTFDAQHGQLGLVRTGRLKSENGLIAGKLVCQQTIRQHVPIVITDTKNWGPISARPNSDQSILFFAPICLVRHSRNGGMLIEYSG